MGEDKVILGLTANLTVIGDNGKEEQVVARIDTGATSSSIDLSLAEKLEMQKIEKTKLVKSASGTKTRPVAKAKVKINGSVIEEEFTLVDRSHMTYVMLVGQNILKQI